MTLLALDYLYMCFTQPQVKTYLALDGPPVVKKYLHGPPHRDPADDGQAFARDAVTGTRSHVADEIGGKQAERDEEDAYHEAHAALRQHLTQSAARSFGLIDEMVVDRFSHHRSRLTLLRPLFEVDDKVEATVVRMGRGPRFDVFIGLGIKVFVVEGRRVHRVEQLRDLAHAQCQLVNGGSCFCHGWYMPCRALKLDFMPQSVSSVLADH